MRGATRTKLSSFLFDDAGMVQNAEVDAMLPVDAAKAWRSIGCIFVPDPAYARCKHEFGGEVRRNTARDDVLTRHAHAWST